MKPIVINNCINQYRVNAEDILNRIICRIPEKYLLGLNEVILFESESKYDRMTYEINKDLNIASIGVNMANTDYNRYPFYSIFVINIDFILRINDHIYNFIIPRSNDKEISEHPLTGINNDWTYFGVWTPLFSVLNLCSELIKKSSKLRGTLFRITNWIVPYKKE